MRKFKCYGFACLKQNLTYDSSELVTYRNKKYCMKCYHQAIIDNKERPLLIHWLINTYKIKYPTGQMLHQIKVFHEDYGYSYLMMLKTLDYIKSMGKLDIYSFKGLGLIPYYYETVKSLEERSHIHKVNEVSSEIKISQSRIKKNDYVNKTILEME